MHVLANVDKRTRRVTRIRLGAMTFEDERILGCVVESIMRPGTSTRFTLEQDGEVVAQFSMMDPSAVEQQDDAAE